MQQKVSPNSSYKYTQQYLERQIKKLDNFRKRKHEGKKITKRPRIVADRHYGELTPEPDMPI